MNAKEKLLIAAEKCLIERGAYAANVKTIALEAGVNHGLVHHYFGSKEGLFIELLNKFHKTMLQPKDVLLQVQAKKRHLLDFLIVNSVVMNEIRTMAIYMPELNRELCLMAKTLCQEIEKIFELDEDDAFLVFSAASGLCLQTRFYNNIDVDKQICKIFRLLELKTGIQSLEDYELSTVM